MHDGFSADVDEETATSLLDDAAIEASVGLVLLLPRLLTESISVDADFLSLGGEVVLEAALLSNLVRSPYNKKREKDIGREWVRQHDDGNTTPSFFLP